MKIRISFLLVAMTVFALPTFAQRYYDHQIIQPDDGGWSGESSYSQGQYLDNPCTSVVDYVWVNYAAYVAGAQAEVNSDRYLFDESTTVGGGMYSASGSSQSDVAYGASLALRQYHKVNTSDNFHVVTVINFDPGSKSTWVTVETACGNGMPDSMQ